MNWNSELVRKELLPPAAKKALSILNGEIQVCAGPTGKRTSRHPFVTEQISCIKMVFDKTLPSMATMQLSGDAENPVAIAAVTDTAALARAIMDVLGSAEVENDTNEIKKIEGEVVSASVVNLAGAEAREVPDRALPLHAGEIAQTPASSYEEGERVLGKRSI